MVCLSTLTYAQLPSMANNLANPAGIESDASGNIWLAETGTGANNGRILRIRTDGTKDTIIAGLPSFLDASNGETAGAWRAMSLPNNRLAVIVGEGPTAIYGRIMIFSLAGFQPGSSKAKTIADTTSTIDISRFALAQTGVTNSNPFSAVLDTDGSWYVADAGANMIIKVTSAGVRSVFAQFPKVPNPTPIGPPVVDAVPTKIIANPDGGFYVATLTGFPFNTGQATIYNLSRTGQLSTYAKGLTMVTDIALDYRTGDMYALQFGAFAFAPTPGFVLGSGKIHRITRGGANSEVVASNIGPGPGLAFDPTGNLYVTSLFTGQLLKMNKPVCSNMDLVITADRPTLTLNTSVKYSLSVKNTSTTAAKNVRIYWLPPYKRFEGDVQPFAFQGAYASKGFYDSWHGYWTIENLAAGETATAYAHLFVVNSTLNVTQTAQVGACNQAFPLFGVKQTDNEEATIVTLAGSTQSLKTNRLPISISPNPADAKITVQINSETDKAWTVKLINAIGQTVAVEKGENSRSFSMDTHNLKTGLYLVEYQSAGERKVEKIVVQH
jgi:hypothetical protein